MVIFESVKMQNFMSVGNSPVEIKLNLHQTTLITGKNGNGKSCLVLDSICFCLYGKAYRKINKPQLVNSVNQKKCSVEVRFTIGKSFYRVVRGIKPNIFEIYKDDNLINQDPTVKDYQKVLEQQILKMNYRAFTQVVILGSAAYVPFMKMETQHRREFIEDLLDIRVFSMMNKLLSAQVKSTKDELKLVDTELSSKKEYAKLLQSHMKSKFDEIESEKEKTKSEIDSLSKNNETLNISIDEITNKLKVEKEKGKWFSSVQSKIDDCNDLIISTQTKIKKLLSKIDEFSEMPTCPTCTQAIPETLSQKFERGMKKKITEYENTIQQNKDMISNYELDLAGSIECSKLVSTYMKELQEVNEQIYGNNLLLTKLNRQYSELENKLNNQPDKTNIKKVAKEIVALDSKKKELLTLQELHSVSQGLLHDNGIKAKVIKQYIPTINKIVNQNLGKLDLFVNFNLDETFTEVIKSRHRDTFTYDSFSQGERQRIDLALLFCWRTIAAMKNSVNTNLVVLDEIIDSSMDGNGMNLTISLLKTMKNNNVFVVSHRENIADEFDASLVVVKKGNFTTIQ